MILITIKKVITYLDVAAPLVALCFASFRKDMWRGERFFIVLYLTVELLLNGWSKLTMLFAPHENNIYIYKINCLVSFSILSLYFLVKWKPRIPRFRYQLFQLFIPFYSLFLLLIIRLEDNGGFNSTSFSIMSLAQCSYCIIYYLSKLRNPHTNNILSQSSFWFITGIFTYYAGSFFIFVSYNVLTSQQNSFTPILWLIHNTIFALMCVLFIIGFRCKKYSP